MTDVPSDVDLIHDAQQPLLSENGLECVRVYVGTHMLVFQRDEGRL